jgi:MtN3 and saliva related transmembrane protein
LSNEFLVTALGLCAACCTTLSFLPQALRAWRTRSTTDISLKMFLLTVLGVVLWLAYGAFIRDVPLIVSNAVTLLLAGSILIMKLRFG